MKNALVGIVLGSRVDFSIMKRCFEVLRTSGVPYVFELASAHRTPDRLARFAVSGGEKGIELYICAAGASTGIAATIASYTTLPVIAVPIDASPLRGQDSLYSVVQAPTGNPIATVGINNSENAALLAIQILALKYPRLRGALQSFRSSAATRVETSYRDMVGEYPELCDPESTLSVNPAEIRTDDDTDPGSEDITPEQSATPPEQIPIRPGATLTHPSPLPLVVPAGRLVPTPRPHEPGGGLIKTVRSKEKESNRIDTIPPPKNDDFVTPIPKDESLSHVEEALQITDDFVETKVFEVSHAEPDEDVLSHAMMVLLEGGIVAFPTDTVYGLAVDATNAGAVRRLYEAKGYDPQRKSLSILIHSQEALDPLVKEVPPAAESVIEKYWPGGLTVLFLRNPAVLSGATESPTVAVRIPNDGIALRLMQAVQRPLAVINASYGESPAAIDAHEVIERFHGKVDCVLDAGPCKSGETSTVLSVLTEPFEVLREGIIPVRDLKRILGTRLKD